MSSPPPTEDELTYLVGLLLLEALDFGEDSVGPAVGYLHGNVLARTPPFDSWSDERQQQIAQQTILRLATEGLAVFFAGLPLPGRRTSKLPRPVRIVLYRLVPRLGSREYSAEEVRDWRRDHALTTDEVAQMVARDVPLSRISASYDRYDYELTPKGEALAEEWHTRYPKDLEARVTGGSAGQ